MFHPFQSKNLLSIVYKIPEAQNNCVITKFNFLAKILYLVFTNAYISKP